MTVCEEGREGGTHVEGKTDRALVRKRDMYCLYNSSKRETRGGGEEEVEGGTRSK